MNFNDIFRKFCLYIRLQDQTTFRGACDETGDQLNDGITDIFNTSLLQA